MDRSFTPEGRTISLVEHDGDYSIRIDSVELMSTRRHASEEKLAALACAHIATAGHPRVLIGGLGMGFTLRAALAGLPARASVVVAEILPAVIAWNRNSAFPLAHKELADSRVTLLPNDVAYVMATEPRGFDSIILDVDNGPAALTTDTNAALYGERGIRSIRRALKPGGCAAFWSAAPCPAFAAVLARAGFTVETQGCRAHATSGGWHTIFLARLGPSGGPAGKRRKYTG